MKNDTWISETLKSDISNVSYKPDRIFHANFFALSSSDFKILLDSFLKLVVCFSQFVFKTEVTMTECQSYGNSLLQVDLSLKS